MPEMLNNAAVPLSILSGFSLKCVRCGHFVLDSLAAGSVC